MIDLKMDDRLESFTPLEKLPDCSSITVGHKFLEKVNMRSNLDSRRKLTFLLDNLALPDGGNVLEIGPGACNFGLEFCQRGYNYHGYDMVRENAELWNAVKSFYKLDCDVIVQDICTVETADKESFFDGIFSFSTFEHVHDQMKALRNCHRMLKPGGRIIIIDGNMLDPRGIYSMLFKRKDGGIKWLFNKSRVYESYGMGWKGKCEDVKSVFWWRRNLKKAGFKVLAVTTTSAFRGWVRRCGLWPFLGGIISVGEKK